MTDEQPIPDVTRTAERIRVIDVDGVPVVSVAGLSVVNGRLVDLQKEGRSCPND